jgi:hypothetical protein
MTNEEKSLFLCFPISLSLFFYAQEATEVATLRNDFSTEI